MTHCWWHAAASVDENPDEIVLLIKHRPAWHIYAAGAMIGGRLMKWRPARRPGDRAATDANLQDSGDWSPTSGRPNTQCSQSWQRVNELSESQPADNYGMSTGRWLRGNAAAEDERLAVCLSPPRGRTVRLPRSDNCQQITRWYDSCFQSTWLTTSSWDAEAMWQWQWQWQAGRMTI